MRERELCRMQIRCDTKKLCRKWVLSLSENLNKGMGIALQNLYYKCKAGNKNRRESNTEAKFRIALSSLLY